MLAFPLPKRQQAMCKGLRSFQVCVMEASLWNCRKWGEVSVGEREKRR